MLLKVKNWLDKVQSFLFSCIMFSMLLILSAHVIMRYVFNAPLIWTDETTTLMQGTIAFLGIGYCIGRRQHTEITLAYDRLPGKLQPLCDIIINAIMLFCLYHMTLAAFKFVANQQIPMGTIPWMKLSYFYIFIPIGFIIAMVYIWVDFVMAIRWLVTGHKPII